MLTNYETIPIIKHSDLNIIIDSSSDISLITIETVKNCKLKRKLEYITFRTSNHKKNVKMSQISKYAIPKQKSMKRSNKN